MLIPVHRQLVPSLLRPRASQAEVKDHLPFGASDRFVCLARLEDNVDILGSQTRPKKMYWIGSDGRRYVIVAKPNVGRVAHILYHASQNKHIRRETYA